MAKDMLVISNFSKTYPGGKKAVDGLNLTVQAGDIYGFIGQNGAGKTTTIRAVTGVLSFDEGEIMIDGHSVREDPIACKSITAYLPDNPDIYEYMTGIQYLTFMADIYEVSMEERRLRMQKYGDLFSLTGNFGDLIGAYSHGMKQKLSLIAALLHQPKLMVLDEPFVGLDPQASFHMKTVMRELCEAGSAIFFSTHVLEVAEKLCDKIAIIREGRLVAQGETAKLRGDKSLEQVFLEVMEDA